MNLLQCKICYLSFNKDKKLPLVLKCGHSLCGVCIGKIKTQAKECENSNDNQFSVECPFCKSKHTYEKEIPKNYLIIEMFEQLESPCKYNIEEDEKKFITKKKALNIANVTFNDLIEKTVWEIVIHHLLDHKIFTNIKKEIENFVTKNKVKDMYDDTIDNLIKKYKRMSPSKESIIDEVQISLETKQDLKSLVNNTKNGVEANVKDVSFKKKKEKLLTSSYYFEGTKFLGVINGYEKSLNNGILFEGYNMQGRREGVGCEVNFNTKEIYIGGFYGKLKCGYGYHIKLLKDEFNIYDNLINNQFNPNNLNNSTDKSNSFSNDSIYNNVFYENLYTVMYKYIGQYKQSKPNGFGEETFNFSLYKGNFKDGFKNSTGRITHLINTDWYIQGEYIEGRLNGIVNENWNGFQYKGEYKNGIKEGFGQIVCKEYIYLGGFFNNLRHGNGEYISNKYYYRGEYYNDIKQGKGYLVNFLADCTYDGEFMNNDYQGEGRLDYNTNQRFLINEACNIKNIIVTNYLKSMDEALFPNKKFYYKAFKGKFEKGKKVEGKLTTWKNVIIDYDKPKYDMKK